MPSTWAAFINTSARTLLWNAHAEDLTAKLDGVNETTIRGTWKRVQADAVQDPDGAGLQTYLGQALMVVKKESIPDPTALVNAVIIREGQTWAIRHVEPQDQWTYVLHLARPKANKTNPRRP